MKATTLLFPLVPFVSTSPIAAPPVSLFSPLLNAASQELRPRHDSHWLQTPRLILYVQNQAYVDGSPLSLLPLLEEHTRVTHIIVSSFHVNQMPGDITLNDDPPNSGKYDNLWREVKVLQSHGVKVMAMFGGAAQGTYSNYGLGARNETEFESYYSYVLEVLHHYKFDGIDLDIEEFIDLRVPLKLLQRLRLDLGPSFLLTLAPVAIALGRNDGINLSGFNYFDLDAQAIDPLTGIKLISWYNTQFYSGFGDPSTPETYENIISMGWDPARVVMGVLDNPNDGYGFVDTSIVVETVKSLRKKFPSFGGVFGWDYFDAGMGQVDGGSGPWQWVVKMRDALFGWLAKRCW